jgi:hypothetical protein
MQPRVQWALKILQLELSNKQSPIEFSLKNRKTTPVLDTATASSY